jgi:uncharacterized protein
MVAARFEQDQSRSPRYSWEMSQENVEIARASAVFSSGGVEELLTFLDPEIEWTTTGAWLEPGTYRGHDGVREYLGAVEAAFDDVRVLPQELVEARDEVISVSRVVGRGKQSGAPVELSLTYVFSFRAGKIVRARNFQTKQEALRALGLE